MTDVVCIGRNIKTTPMEEIRWQNFISDLYESFVDVYFSGGGKGIYKEGCEDSYCIVGMLHVLPLKFSLPTNHFRVLLVSNSAGAFLDL